MKSKIYLLTLLFACSTLAMSAQEKTSEYAYTYAYQIAVNNYETMHYPKAIEQFEDLKSKGKADDYINNSLAISYYKVGDFKKAEKALKDLIDKDKANDEIKFYYLQSLKQNDELEAARLFEEEMFGGVVALDTARSEDDPEYKVQAVYFNSEASDFSAVPYNRGKELVFASARGDGPSSRRYAWDKSFYLDLYVVTPDGKSKPELLSSKLSSAFHDGPASFNMSGSEIYFSRNVKNAKGELKLAIFYAKKDRDGKWQKPEMLTFCDTKYNYSHPCWDEKKRTLYFSSDMPGGIGGYDIFSVKNMGRNKWKPAVNMGEYINTPFNEGFPFIGIDRTVFFSSEGHNSFGGLDIFSAVATSDTTYDVKSMGEPINSKNDDFSFYYDKKKKQGFMASNRPNKEKEDIDNIYHVKLIEKIPPLVLNLRVMDSKTNKVMNDCRMTITNTAGDVYAEDSMKSVLSSEVDRKMNFKIILEKEGYLNTEFDFNAGRYKQVNNQISLVQKMTKEPDYGIYGTIFSAGDDKEALSEVEVLLRDQDDKEIKLTTDEKGEFRSLLAKNTDYSIVISKVGFIPKIVKFTTKDKKPGWINANDFIEEIVLEKIDLGKSMVIYFALGASDVNEKALPELEDMINFMKTNPTLRIEVGAHTDARGSSSYNQKLSEKRAAAIVKYMQNKGIDANRFESKGYGESQLINQCADGVECSEEEHQANRRCEAKIIQL